MNRFEELLKGLRDGSEDLFSTYARKLEETKKYCDTHSTLKIFIPDSNYKENIKFYNGYNIGFRNQSDSICRGIWGVTNMELYNIYSDHMKVDNKYDYLDDIVEYGRKVTYDNTKIEAKLNLPLLSPNNMRNKGVFETNPTDNYFGVKGSLETLADNETSLKTWFDEYSAYYNDEDNNYGKYSHIWDITIRKFIKEKGFNPEESEDKQALLELGWIPGIPYKTNHGLISKIKISSRKSIDLSYTIEMMNLDESEFNTATIQSNSIFLIYLRDGSRLEYPLITFDFGEFYHINNEGSIYAIDDINLLPYTNNGKAKIYATRAYSSMIDYFKDILGTIINDSTVINKIKDMDSVSSDKPDIYLLRFIKAIFNKSNLKNVKISDMLRIQSLPMFMLGDKYNIDLKTAKNIALKLDRIYGFIDNDVDGKEDTEYLLSALKEDYSELNLLRLKPFIEANLSGMQLDIFESICENVLDTKDTSILENLDLSNTFRDMNTLEDIENVYNDISEDSINEGDLYTLWKLNESIKTHIYENGETGLYGIKSKVLTKIDKVSGNIKVINPKFNFNRFIEAVEPLIESTSIKLPHIRYRTNLNKK